MKFLALLALCGGMALGQNSTDYVNPDNYPNPFAACGDTSGKGAFERNYRGDEPISIGLTPPDRNRPGERLSPVIDGLLEDSVWSYSDTMGIGNMTKMFSILQGGTDLCAPTRNGEYRFNGANDFFAVWRYMYNKNGLYIGIQIHDDIIDTLEGSIYMKDAFELKIDPSDWGQYESGAWNKDQTGSGTDYDCCNEYLRKAIQYSDSAEMLIDTTDQNVIYYTDSSLYVSLIKKYNQYYDSWSSCAPSGNIIPYNSFRRYWSINGTTVKYPDNSQNFFLYLNKEILGSKMSSLINEAIVDGAEKLKGIEIASKSHGIDAWGRSIIHVEIKIPFHSGVWSSLDALNYFDANGLPREGQLFKMSFANTDGDSSIGTTTTHRNLTYLITEMSDLFHEELIGSHWSDTKYYPTFMFSRTTISGVRPIIGTISSTKNELTNVTDVDFTIAVTPNPFNPSTQISVGNSKAPVAISIYDITGKCVADFNTAANSSVTWNAKGFSSGFYLVKAKSANKTLSKRILLNR